MARVLVVAEQVLSCSIKNACFAFDGKTYILAGHNCHRTYIGGQFDEEKHNFHGCICLNCSNNGNILHCFDTSFHFFQPDQTEFSVLPARYAPAEICCTRQRSWEPNV